VRALNAARQLAMHTLPMKVKLPVNQIADT